MYEKTDKRRLYWLMDRYLHNDINERTFCDEFYYCYDLELDRTTLTEIEKRAFSELNQVTSRFSQYEQDHLLDNHAFTTVKDLKNKIQETNNFLQGESKEKVMKNSFKILLKIIGLSIIYYLIILFGAYVFYQKYPLDGKFTGLLEAIAITRDLINVFIAVVSIFLLSRTYDSIQRKYKYDTIGYMLALIYMLLLVVIFNLF